MTSLITLSGVDQAISDLNYRNANALKSKMVYLIRQYYIDERTVDRLREIDTDVLVKALWETGDQPEVIRNRRKNYNSIKSSVNSELKRLYEAGKNPEGILIDDNNIFAMSDEAKDKILKAFGNEMKADGAPSLNQLLNMLIKLSETLPDLINSEGKDNANALGVIDQLKDLVRGLSEKNGSSIDDLEEVEEDEALEELEEVEAETDLEAVEEAGVDDDLEEVEEAEADDDLEEIETEAEIKTDEDLEAVEDVESETDLEEIEETEPDEDLEPIEAEADVEGIEEAEAETDLETVEEAGADDDFVEIEEEEADDDLEEVEEEEAPEAVEEVEAKADTQEIEGAEAETDLEPDEAEADPEELDETEEIDEDDVLEAVEEAEADDDLEEIEEDDLEEALEIETDEDLEEVEPEADVEEIEEVEAEADPEEIEEAEDLDADELLEDIDEPDLEPVEEAEEVGLPVDSLGQEYPSEVEAQIKNARLLAEEFDGYLGAMDRYFNHYIYFAQGDYTVGNPKPKKNERREQIVPVSPFYIGRFPVTNGLFEIFVEKTGYQTTAEKAGFGTVYYGRFRNTKDESTGLATSTWNSSLTCKTVKGACWYQPSGPGSSLHHKRNHPVVQISFEDAMAFAAWTGKKLPTEDEWEAAARTQNALMFPWGDDWQKDACNTEESCHGETTPVDQYIEFANGIGVADVLGNVLEWTRDDFRALSYNDNSPRDYVAKGGSWTSGENIRLCDCFKLDREAHSNILGFRCVAD